jgi:hypothetical protein
LIEVGLMQHLHQADFIFSYLGNLATQKISTQNMKNRFDENQKYFF